MISMMNDALSISSSIDFSPVDFVPVDFVMVPSEVASEVSCFSTGCSLLVVSVSNFCTELVEMGSTTLFEASCDTEDVDAAVETVGVVKGFGADGEETGSLFVVLEVPNNKDFILDLMRARMAIIQLFLVSFTLCDE